MKTRILATLLPLTLLLQTACGRENKIYADPVKAETPAAPTNTTDGRAFLPRGFFNQSVNRSSVDLTKETDESALRFQTAEQASTAGAFNDASATGNRALLGIANYDKKKLSEIHSLAVDTKLTSGDVGIGVTLIADLECDGAQVHAIEALPSDLDATKESSNFSGYNRFTAKFAEARWRSGSAEILDGATVLLPAHGAATAKSLDDLLAKYPNACIRNLASGDDGLPKNLPTAGLLLSVGDNANLKSTTVFVKRIAIEFLTTTETLQAADWDL